MSENSFEKDRACYDQNFQQMRSLNTQMVRIPQVSVTITGGIWFVVGSSTNLEAPVSFAFLLFAWIANFGLGVSCLRIRDVMSAYLEKIKRFSPENYADASPKDGKFPFSKEYSMIKVYVTLMCIAGLFSAVVAMEFYYPFDTESSLLLWVKWIASVAVYALTVYSTFVLISKKPVNG